MLRVQDFVGIKKKLTLEFFLKAQNVVLPYKANSSLRGEITKGSSFESDWTLKNTLKSFSLYPFLEKKVDQ